MKLYPIHEKVSNDLIAHTYLVEIFLKDRGKFLPMKI